MTLADEFPAYDDKHNPATCTRHACRRCAGPHEANPPAIGPNPHRVHPPEPPRAVVKGLTLVELGLLLQRIGDDLTTDNGQTWRRFYDWQTAPKLDTEERGGGDGGTGSEDARRHRMEDRRVARYFAEYADLLTNLVAPLHRLDRLHTLAEVEDRTVHRTRTGELDPLLAAEAAAAGYCTSCWRYEQTCYEREKDSEGHYYDRNLCRRCARFRNEHGITPPVDLLRIWHGLGRRTWTTAEVDAALTKARVGKRKAS